MQATFIRSAQIQSSGGDFVFLERSSSAAKLLGSAFAIGFVNALLSAQAPGGPHDVFKSATHLSLERALSSKHNRDRGYKQMVHKKMWVQSDRLDGACCFCGNPHWELRQLSQEGHQRLMGFSHGCSEAVTVPLQVSSDSSYPFRILCMINIMFLLFVNNLLAAEPSWVQCLVGDKRQNEN